MPDVSITKPRGPLNVAFVPCPSALPDDARPASVVTTATHKQHVDVKVLEKLDVPVIPEAVHLIQSTLTTHHDTRKQTNKDTSSGGINGTYAVVVLVCHVEDTRRIHH